MSTHSLTIMPVKFEVYSEPEIQTRLGRGQVFIECTDQREHDPVDWKWAVRKLGACLNHDGEWEYEPMPSSRDDAFLHRCRFTLAAAEDAVRKVWK